MMPNLRDATVDDLEVIVSLTRAQRHQLAAWSPVYFKPREGADEGHGNFLAFIVSSDDHETLVFDDGGSVFGFFVRIDQDNHVWVDDLCIDDQQRWSEVVPLLIETNPDPWTTCVAVADERRQTELAGAGLRRISTYYAMGTAGVQPEDGDSSRIALPTFELSPDRAPTHTFGGRPFSPDLPGALVVTDDHNGYVVGSPSMTPPIYDPGGPTCVIDQMIGDRSTLMESALAVASGRGDAQVIVVCDADDGELDELLMNRGFTPEVLVIGS